MKRMFILSSMIMTFLVFGPGIASATIIGSRHDFSQASGGSLVFQSTNETQVCIFCHTPHGGVATDPAGTGINLPLWNRTLNYTATFTMYDSDTFDGKTSYINSKPTGMSLLCLTCHDGVTAINSVLNYSPTGPILMPANKDQIGDVTAPSYRNPNIGRDLSNDHPVSFLYDAALVGADTTTRGGVVGLNDPTTISPLILYSSRLECSTCHDPHEDGSTTNQAPFLRMTNAGSQMCMTCHIK